MQAVVKNNFGSIAIFITRYLLSSHNFATPSVSCTDGVPIRGLRLLTIQRFFPTARAALHPAARNEYNPPESGVSINPFDKGGRRYRYGSARRTFGGENHG